MIQPDAKLAYTIPEAAEACSVRVFTIRTAIRNFELTPRKIARHSVLSRDDLLNWINRQPRMTATQERKRIP
jgi:hypothetical protein